MESSPVAARPNVTFVPTSPRPTPTAPRASRFSEVLSNTVVRSAETAMRTLPGSPIMAVAVRGASGAGAWSVPMSTMSAEGPTAASPPPAFGPTGRLATTTSALTTGAPATGSVAGVGGDAPTIEASLAQSHDMNLFYLQVQESINAQNRSFTALSNVMKAQHDTVKTAIGNIR